MKKNKKNKKNLSLFYNIVSFLLIILFVFTMGVIIFFEILPILYLLLSLFALSFVCFIFVFLLRKKNLRFWV